MGTTDFGYQQVSALRGRVALHTAAVGALMLGAGAFVAWMMREEPWPAQAGVAMLVVPAVALGTFVLGLAGIFQFRRAEWVLLADDRGVELLTRTSRGRILKREAVAATDFARLTWIEGDADISPGLRAESQSGKGLFIPADSFDCAAFAAFAVDAYPGVATAGLIEQVPPRR